MVFTNVTHVKFKSDVFLIFFSVIFVNIIVKIMIDRIQKILEHYHLSSSQFANEIGIQRSAMSHILSGRNKPSLDFVLKVKNRFPEINTDWLLFGKGEMVEKLNEKHLEEEQKPDLFAEITNGDPVEEKSREILEYQEDLEKPQKKSSESEETEDLVEKIVFFYKNGKFRIYIP